MGRELLSSKVVVVEEEPRVRGIATGPTSVAGAVGITERGPLGVATLCTSFPEFEEKFGSFTRDSDLALAALGFFENGGSRLWVVRACHHDDVSDPTTATARRSSGVLLAPGAAAPATVEGAAVEPFALRSGDQLLFRSPSGDLTISIDARAAHIESGEGPFVLDDGDTLELLVDGVTQEIVFRAASFADITTATSPEVAAAINTQVGDARAGSSGRRVFIETDATGRGAAIEVAGGSAAAALGFPSGSVSGGGNVAHGGAVLVAELAALAAADASLALSATDDRRLRLATVATGRAAHLEVLVGSAAAAGLPIGAFDGDDAASTPVGSVEARELGAFGDGLRVEIRPPTSGASGAFDLAVVDGTRTRELFRSLVLVESGDRFVERVLNDDRTGSQWIRIHLARPITVALPAQRVALAGGNDGLTDLNDADFIGSESAGNGIHALDRVLDLAILLMPGRATPAVHDAMLRYCEIDRDGLVFAVLDPPAGLSATEIVDYVGSAALEGTSELCAIYWPRLRIPNPSRAVYGGSVDVIAPPSGIVTGVYARTDAARPGGIYDPPAGIEIGRMFGVLGFETDEVLEERKRDLIYPHRVNPLTTGPSLPRYIDGSRTLKGNGNFPFVSSRRGVSFIERSLKRGLEFVRHRNPTDSLLAEVDRSVRIFLLEQAGLDAFASRDPDKAFFVEVSQRLISVPGGTASRVLVRVGLAMNAPAEFVVISVSQDTRAIEAELAATS